MAPKIVRMAYSRRHLLFFGIVDFRVEQLYSKKIEDKKKTEKKISRPKVSSVRYLLAPADFPELPFSGRRETLPATGGGWICSELRFTTSPDFRPLFLPVRKYLANRIGFTLGAVVAASSLAVPERRATF